MIAGALRSAVRRSENGVSRANTIPALALLVNPLIERPGKATAASTPGKSQIALVAFVLSMNPQRAEEIRAEKAEKRVQLQKLVELVPLTTYDELVAVAPNTDLVIEGGMA